jgi:hypothetical protein
MSIEQANERPRLGWGGCLGIGILVFIFLACLLLTTCVSRVEVMRAKSPDIGLVATVVEINAGATTDFAYEINIARNWPLRWDHAVAGFYGAGRSDCAYGVNIRWINNETLSVTYKDAKSMDVDQAAQMFGRTVRIIAKEAVDDPAAPCGGMESGQQGKVAIVR